MKCERCGLINEPGQRFCSHCGQPLEVNPMWYYSKDDQPNGPFSEMEMQDLFNKGIIHEETPVWQEELDEWVPMKETSMVINKEEAVWYYSLDDDQNQGPFSTIEMIEKFNNKEIDDQVQVWKEGMSSWEYIGQSALAQFLPVSQEEQLVEQFTAQQVSKDKQLVPNQDKPWWIAAVVAASLLLIFVGGYMFHSIDKQARHDQAIANEQREQEAQEDKEKEQETEEKKKEDEEKKKQREQKEKENKEKQEQIKQRKLLNEQTRQALYPYYSNLYAYQTSAASVESDFMDNYLKGDVNDRVEHHNNAVAVYNTINNELANITYIGCDENSDYLDDYEQLVQCYVDLRDYVGTYVSAWDVDTNYEKPEEHKEEIMNIVTNAYGGGSTNASLVDYNNRYALINLEE